MKMNEIFKKAAKFSVSDELRLKQFNSLTSIKREYDIIDTHRVRQMFRGNKLLLCSDDSETACYTMEEFNAFIKRLDSLKMDAKNIRHIKKYVESRISKYTSPRRGPCVALRGKPYYTNILKQNNKKAIKHLNGMLAVDFQMYNYMARIDIALPRELYYITIEHIKNIMFIVMNAYITKSLKNDNFFKPSQWLLLDNICRTLWEEFVNVLFCENSLYINTSKISAANITLILDRISDQNIYKVRELDSAKTLMRLAALFFDGNAPDFDYYFGLLYGGIEMPYALYGYSIFHGKKFGQIIPAMFSLNRIKKGVLPELILGNNGLIKETQFNKIIPNYFLDAVRDSSLSKAVVLDNNITSGYSLKIFTESLSQIINTVKCSVAEINIQEIKAILEKRIGFTNKQILISGKELYCRPVGEYITCFGLNDSSQVVNRIKFITGQDSYQQAIGYDFDDTLFKTGKIHGLTWNTALANMGIQLDVNDMPTNSGFTFKEAASNIYSYVSEKKATDLEKNMFVEMLIKHKKKALLNIPTKEIMSIGANINMIKYDESSTNIIITNNTLEFVLHILQKKELLDYFSFLVCNDLAMCVKTEEKIILTGSSKPSIEACMEAFNYFDIPMIKKYVGDNPIIDGDFANRMKCEFVLV